MKNFAGILFVVGAIVAILGESRHATLALGKWARVCSYAKQSADPNRGRLSPSTRDGVSNAFDSAPVRSRTLASGVVA